MSETVLAASLPLAPLAFEAGQGMLLALAFAAIVLFVLALPKPLSRWMDKRRADWAETARVLHRPPPSRFAVAKGPLAGFVLFLVFSLLGFWMWGLLAGFIVWRMVDAEPEHALKRRRKKFDGQFVDSLVGLSNCLKAGMSLPQAVEQVAKDMPAPCGQEYEQIFQEYRLGKSIEQAFSDASERIESRNYDVAVLAFKAGKERGGNVAEVFEKIAASIREIWRLEEHIETVSTEGKSSARFMTFMPAVFLVLLYFMDPDATMLLFTDPAGNMILTIVIVFNLIGHFWIRRIMSVDV
jgi:tight adherence protein B